VDPDDLDLDVLAHSLRQNDSHDGSARGTRSRGGRRPAPPSAGPTAS
jgi:hypothetical protein